MDRQLFIRLVYVAYESAVQLSIVYCSGMIVDGQRFMRVAYAAADENPVQLSLVYCDPQGQGLKFISY